MTEQQSRVGRVESVVDAIGVPPWQPVLPALAGKAAKSTPRRLLFYTHALTHGGAERVMAMLASAFAEAGDDVLFVVDDVAVDHGIVLSSRARLVRLEGNHAQQLRALVALLKEQQPAWILSALASSNAKMAAAAFAAGMGARHIMTWHGFPQAETSLLSRAGYWLMPFLASRAAQQVCVSDALLTHVASKGVAMQRATRIYNPVDMTGLGVDRPAMPNRTAPVILSAGRLAPVKDFLTLIRAFAALPQPQARLVILGEGCERQRLEMEARRLGVADRLSLPGHVHDMRPWFQSADVFAVSSLSESFSNVLVEALSYGLPVVATDCGGPREILDHGRYGALVACGDVDGMAKAIADACEDDGLQMKFRRDRARNFDSATAFRHYDALLRRLEPLRAA